MCGSQWLLPAATSELDKVKGWSSTFNILCLPVHRRAGLKQCVSLNKMTSLNGLTRVTRHLRT